MIAVTSDILQHTPTGLTGEALVRQVMPHLPRRVSPAQIIDVLRKMPQRFVEGEDGRWRLREQGVLLAPEDVVASSDRSAVQQQSLRQGCYVVFDLETTSSDIRSAETEIIQIAAQRWVDGIPQHLWATFVRPNRTIPAHIVEVTHIWMDDVRGAPSIREALRDFFAYVGELPLIAHNGASFDGPLLFATCERLGVPVPSAFRVLDTLPLARTLLPLEAPHNLGTLAALARVHTTLMLMLRCWEVLFSGWNENFRVDQRALLCMNSCAGRVIHGCLC